MLEDRKPAAANEVVMVDGDGYLLEGLSSNFAAIIGGTVYTAEDGVLKGTIRNIILDVCDEKGIPVKLEVRCLSFISLSLYPSLSIYISSFSSSSCLFYHLILFFSLSPSSYENRPQMYLNGMISKVPSLPVRLVVPCMWMSLNLHQTRNFLPFALRMEMIQLLSRSPTSSLNVCCLAVSRSCDILFLFLSCVVSRCDIYLYSNKTT